MISDKQRAKHVYPVLEMLSNKIKGLKLEKNPEIRHRRITHALHFIWSKPTWWRSSFQYRSQPYLSGEAKVKETSRFMPFLPNFSSFSRCFSSFSHFSTNFSLSEVALCLTVATPLVHLSSHPYLRLSLCFSTACYCYKCIGLHFVYAGTMKRHNPIIVSKHTMLGQWDDNLFGSKKHVLHNWMTSSPAYTICISRSKWRVLVFWLNSLSLFGAVSPIGYVSRTIGLFSCRLLPDNSQ